MSLSSSVMKRLAARRNEDPDLLERTSFPVEFRISGGGYALAVLGIAMGLSFVAAGFYLYAEDPSNDYALWLPAVIGAMFALLGAYMIYSGRRFRFIVDKDSIRIRENAKWTEFSAAHMTVEERNGFLVLHYPGGSHTVNTIIKDYPLLASLLLRLAHQTGQDGDLSYDEARRESKARDEKRNRKGLVVLFAVLLPLLVVYYISNN